MPKRTTPALTNVVSCLKTVAAALDDIAEANKQLALHQKRMQVLLSEFLRVVQKGAKQQALASRAAGVKSGSTARTMPATLSAELLAVQMSMQRENQVFSSVSNVLKTRHDTVKNSIGNIR